MKKSLISLAISGLLGLGMVTTALADKIPTKNTGSSSADTPMLAMTSASSASVVDYVETSFTNTVATYNPNINYSIATSYYTSGYTTGACDTYMINYNQSQPVAASGGSQLANCKGTNKNILVEVLGVDATSTFSTRSVLVDISALPASTTPVKYSVVAYPLSGTNAYKLCVFGPGAPAC